MVGERDCDRGVPADYSLFFEQVGVNRICAQHDPNNPGSGKVMVKSGLRYEGTLRQADYNNRGVADAAVYGILAEEYRPEDYDR